MSDPFVKVIAFSISAEGIPIITAHFRYWRGIHSEIMTHRVFSRNARSSRAVPVARMLDEIKNDPFIPRHWGKNQKGMQATEECNTLVGLYDESYYGTREQMWLWARDRAVEAASGFNEAGYHKQVVNRLLEPYMWIDTLITSTDWSNFFALRDHQDAEPHFRDLAQLAKEAFAKSTPELISRNSWHLPYVTQTDLDEIVSHDPEDQAWCFDMARQISAARCARISYSPFDGEASHIAELDRAAKLLKNPVHASPFEHQAQPDSVENGVWLNKNKWGNFYGWKQNRKFIAGHETQDSFKL
jgi:hypothetical protein